MLKHHGRGYEFCGEGALLNPCPYGGDALSALAKLEFCHLGWPSLQKCMWAVYSLIEEKVESLIEIAIPPSIKSGIPSYES